MEAFIPPSFAGPGLSTSQDASKYTVTGSDIPELFDRAALKHTACCCYAEGRAQSMYATHKRMHACRGHGLRAQSAHRLGYNNDIQQVSCTEYALRCIGIVRSAPKLYTRHTIWTCYVYIGHVAHASSYGTTGTKMRYFSPFPCFLLSPKPTSGDRKRHENPHKVIGTPADSSQWHARKDGFPSVRAC